MARKQHARSWMRATRHAQTQKLVVIAAVLAATVGAGTDVMVASAAGQAASVRGAQSATSNTAAAAAASVFAAINHSRAVAHLPAVWLGGRLVNDAHAHNLAMAAANQLSHQLPGEPSLGARASRLGVTWSWLGENVGESPSLSSAGALYLEGMMMNSAGHRANILSTRFSRVGVDVVYDSVHHTLWLTEDFAN
ncbi:MAG: CAP domain-containing protein [Candidatus Dormibacter sp.]